MCLIIIQFTMSESVFILRENMNEIMMDNNARFLRRRERFVVQRAQVVRDHPQEGGMLVEEGMNSVWWKLREVFFYFDSLFEVQSVFCWEWGGRWGGYSSFEEDFQKVKCYPNFWRLGKWTDQQGMVGLLGNFEDTFEEREFRLLKRNVQERNLGWTLLTNYHLCIVVTDGIIPSHK